MSRISLIIPTYNRADLLVQALDSVLAQTRVPDEIIVVDDGSTDDTPERLNAYAAPVICLTQTNQGRSAARNAGLRRATGDLLALLDSDDLLYPDSIAHRAAYLDVRPDIDVVYSDTMIVDGAGQPQRLFRGAWRRKTLPSGDVFGAFAQNNVMPPCAYLFRRACLATAGGFVTTFEPVEDADFWMRIAAEHRFGFLDEVLCGYRLHETNSLRTQRDDFTRRILDVQRQAFDMPAFARLSAREQAAVYASHGTKHARAGDLVTARQWYVKAVRTAPFYSRPYLLLVLDALLGRRRLRLTNGQGIG